MSILHFSEFTGTDGDLVTSLTPTVGSALLQLGSVNWKIKDNRAYCDDTGTAASMLYTQDVLPADYTVTASVRMLTSTSYFQLRLREVAADTFYYVQLDGSGNISFGKAVAWAYTTFYTTTTSFATARTIEVRVAGTSVRLFLDGTELGTGYTDTEVTAGGDVRLVSLYATNSATAGWHVDYLKVETPSAAPSGFGPLVGSTRNFLVR